MNICTTIEQSKKLIELGIDVNTADMVWQSIEDDESFDGTWEVIPKGNSLDVGYKDDVPAWSLSSLFKLLPRINGLKPLIDLDNVSVEYTGLDYQAVSDNPLDAAFEMVCWLLKTKKI